MPSIQPLVDRLGDKLDQPGSDGYKSRTSPRNALPRQQPAAVVRVRSAQDVQAAVRAATTAGFRVYPQATGHGAGAAIMDDVVLLDCSGLSAVEPDTATDTARVGAGATWGDVDAALVPLGRVGLCGTAPDVSVSGYHANGGISWFSRPYGLAAAHLRSVEFVDSTGDSHIASEQENTEALWAWRGGGGVGIATSLTFDSVPAPQLWGGFAIWTDHDLAAVAAAWIEATATFGPSLTSNLAHMMMFPDIPVIPEEQRGKSGVLLSVASPDGSDPALDRLLAAVPTPVANTFGPLDARRLGMIHLDPPVATPAWGEGRWLRTLSPRQVRDILAFGGDDSPLVLRELHHMASSVPATDGALTAPAGPFLLHAIGDAGSPDAAKTVRAAQRDLLESITAINTGIPCVSFCDGHAELDGVHSRATLDRLANVRSQFDPDNRIMHSVVVRPVAS